MRRRSARVMKTLACAATLTTMSWWGLQTASARPEAPPEVCVAYPDIPACAAGQVGCDFCHTTPPARNVYGEDLLKAFPGESLDVEAFKAALPDALKSIEDLDSDDDGVSNIDELNAGSSAADPTSLPATNGGVCGPEGAGPADDPNPSNGWDVCGYDHRYVFKKVYLDVCGESPTREAVADFEARPEDERMEAIESALKGCLDSENWLGKEGVLWHMASDKIEPIAAIKAGENEGPIPLADYDDDYAFFVYTQIDDHDAREMLTGQYFVARVEGNKGTTYETWDRSLTQDVEQRGFFLAQAVSRTRRAGLMTHRWFLMSNTMFTGMPRTTAAQAYRAFLGYDISKMEGLFPVENEPVDYDAKGVQRQECAVCHSTLDPLTYPFSRYEGIGGGEGDIISGGTRVPFAYNRRRMDFFTTVDGPMVSDTPEGGMLFGEPVGNLVAWARAAADSEAFARATVKEYWVHFLGEAPRPEDTAEFTQLWQDFMTTHDYRVEPMIADLIRTEAYGVP
ncbi:MAG: hypothetical protein ACE366_14510 [Bradymonadia bacterium]